MIVYLTWGCLGLKVLRSLGPMRPLRRMPRNCIATVTKWANGALTGQANFKHRAGLHADANLI